MKVFSSCKNLFFYEIFFNIYYLWESVLFMNSFWIFSTRENFLFLCKSFLPVRISSFYQKLSYLYEFILLMKIFSSRENLFFLWKSFLSVRISFFYFANIPSLLPYEITYLLAFWQLATKVGSTLRSWFSAEVHVMDLYSLPLVSAWRICFLWDLKFFSQTGEHVRSPMLYLLGHKVIQSEALIIVF